MLMIRCLIILVFCTPLLGQTTQQSPRLNILLITADDMNWDTPGFAGCKVPDITPNLDRLAGEGLYFRNAHVTVAVCQPSRSALMTGRYPHRNGAVGFNPINSDVPTLGERLHEAGYLNGIFAKVPHLAPIERFCWDQIVQADALGQGRDPQLYHQHAREFFERAKRENKPFFLMANSQDPHRPFAGSDAEKRRAPGGEEEGEARPRRRQRAATFPSASRYYKPDEITVPGFLPDLPDVRKELAQYYTSAHRCDEIVGGILRALDEAGLAQETLVMFLSDNGISEPFAKSNCYLTSTRTPWVVRWPGKTKPGQVDDTHFISGIDFLPTVLEAAKLKPLDGADGRSFVPLLLSESQPQRDHVFTVYHETVARREFPMRCIQDKNFGYIYNGWSDGKTRYQSEPMGGLAFAAMKQAATTNPAVAKRIEVLIHRTAEELYDLAGDPNCLKNLADDPAQRERLVEMRKSLVKWMEQTGDPLLETYRKQIR